MKINTFEKIALLLKVLSLDGMKPETAAWLDEMERIARDAAMDGGASDGTGVPFERGTRPIAVARLDGEEIAKPGRISDIVPDGREEHPSINKFLKIADELQLVRFRGPNFVKLVGRVAARGGMPPQCYEIEVAKVPRPRAAAVVKRNGHVLFQILGDVNSNLLEVMAVSALHRWWKTTRGANRRSCESKKRAKAAKHAAIEEAQG